MDKDSVFELQKIDCNCNDCKHMKRDFEKYKSYDKLYKNANGQVEKPSYRLQYGDCLKLNKPVSFIPCVCQLDTQKCFEHRKNN